MSWEERIRRAEELLKQQEWEREKEAERRRQAQISASKKANSDFEEEMTETRKFFEKINARGILEKYRREVSEWRTGIIDYKQGHSASLMAPYSVVYAKRKWDPRIEHIKAKSDNQGTEIVRGDYVSDGYGTFTKYTSLTIFVPPFGGIGKIQVGDSAVQLDKPVAGAGSFPDLRDIIDIKDPLFHQKIDELLLRSYFQRKREQRMPTDWPFSGQPFRHKGNN